LFDSPRKGRKDKKEQKMGVDKEWSRKRPMEERVRHQRDKRKEPVRGGNKRRLKKGHPRSCGKGGGSKHIPGVGN